MHQPGTRTSAIVLHLPQYFGRDVAARGARLADDLVFARRFELRLAFDQKLVAVVLVPVELNVEVAPADELAVGHLLRRAAAVADHAVDHRESIDGHGEFFRSHCKQRVTRFGRRVAQRRARTPHAGRARSAALVDGLLGMTLDDADAVRRKIELLGDQLDPADVGALTHVDLADPSDHAAVLIDADVAGERVAWSPTREALVRSKRARSCARKRHDTTSAPALVRKVRRFILWSWRVPLGRAARLTAAQDADVRAAAALEAC